MHHQVAFQAASRARNLGVQHARGEWVGFPDDDCQFMPDTLIEIERLTRQSQISVVTGQTTDASGGGADIKLDYLEVVHVLIR